METRTYAPDDCGICNKPISSISGVIYVDGRKYHEGKCYERLLMVKAAANDNQTAPASHIEVEARTPWHVEKRETRVTVIDSHGKVIAFGCGLNEWNREQYAALIVRFANSHQALVDALQELLRSGVEHDDPRINYMTMQIDKAAIEQARAALKLAGE